MTGRRFFFDENDKAMSWEARTLSKQHRCKEIKDHTSARTGLSDTGKSRVEGEALINLKTGLKSMSKPTKMRMIYSIEMNLPMPSTK